LVASDGGIFAFGDAGFFGSTGAMQLNQPIVGMAPLPAAAGTPQTPASPGTAPTSGSKGYWLLGADGGLFSFGDANFFGSLPGTNVKGPAVAMRPTGTGGGYLIVTAAGTVASFGDAPVLGGVPDAVPGYRGGVVGLDVKAASVSP
jgi:hypothetical protein